ncbi:transporter substrate-binding domain-containing protein [Deinococcus wulumuqiensis]|uniref:Cysteine ABC transporter substrate-binding protein n=1 Tax=Deinococcus wulumuqiensis TaxID=980427 RepID=A0AAV4K849_9DEIO|nr:transporter substrate-binding domain-containing protein [Deinococcus wulumuqiensis]QII19345.1 transporter substrate-binding domain-containing protein [Deinococcus wulumuqiensis R12]GGI92494.1 cysteine ABC transporter substrate-binding protein [Deinococcus wulumuqiensis]GGP31138.1 cysteine ABC transporter substrate-binding protein [Deinococcus wulumuqiensis]
MKKSLLSLLVPVALALSLGACSSPRSTLEGDTLKIGMEGTYPPFTSKNEQGELVGFDVDIARAVAQKLGLKPEFVLTEWSGILAGLQANKYDVIVNQVGITPERQNSIGFSQPYAYSRPQIIVAKGSTFDPKSLEDLRGKRVGSTLGSNYEKQLIDTGGITIVTYPGAPEILADLVAGRIDAAYNDRLVVNHIINDQKLAVRGAEQIGEAAPVGIALKKGNSALKDQIDKALTEMRSDGTFQAISQKWFGQDVGQP